MKVIKAAALCLIAAIAVLMFASCAAVPSEAPDITGEWVCVALTDSDGNLSEEDAETLKSLGLYITISVKDDGTAKFDIMGDTLECGYNAKCFNIRSESGKGALYKLEKDGRLTLNIDGEKLVFERVQ